MATFGVTNSGFALKRLSDILADMITALSTVQDPATGESLIVDLADENDPFVQFVHVMADGLSLCWEQLQQIYSQNDPLLATGTSLSGSAQFNGITRLPGESDSSLRVRQQQSTTLAARGMIEDCWAAIMSVPGVSFCRIYQNPTGTPDGNGLPAKSLAAMVVGGDDNLVASALFQHASLCSFYGSTVVNYVDVQQVGYECRFTRPDPISVYVHVALVVTNNILWPSDGAERVKQAVLNYAISGASAVGIAEGFSQNGFVPGASVYATELAIPVGSVPGVRILGITVGDSPNPSNTSVAIAWNQQASIEEANITVTV